MFQQELCPPHPFQSHTQQWTYRRAGLLINSPVESLDLKGCYISSARTKYTRSCGGHVVMKPCRMEQFLKMKQCIALVTSRHMQDFFFPKYYLNLVGSVEYWTHLVATSEAGGLLPLGRHAHVRPHKLWEDVIQSTGYMDTKRIQAGMKWCVKGWATLANWTLCLSVK